MEMEAEVFGLITDIIHPAVLVAGGRALDLVPSFPSFPSLTCFPSFPSFPSFPCLPSFPSLSSFPGFPSFLCTLGSS